MDLTYMNAQREDVGVLLRYDLDLAFGSNENDFACTVHKSNHCCEAGYYLYMEGAEYGGIIDAVQSDTASGDITYSGRTWHGMLEAKILEPDAGQDYLVLDGEANAVIGQLLKRVGLDSLFVASAETSGVTVKNYQMNRYIGAYSGIVKMLKSANAKLKITFADRKVVLSAAPVVDYTQEGLYSDIIDFTAKKVRGKVNHLICLGKGELAERTVVHLYADAEGNVSQTKTFSGIDEYTTIYDYSFAETTEELIESGTEKLKELRLQDNLSVSFNSTVNEFDIGDIVGAYDTATGISVDVAITQKIITIRNGLTSVSYSTDKANTSVSVGNSTGESGGGQGSSDVAKDSEMLGGKAPAYYLPAYNLLDNSDFCNPVNQRGITSGATVDKWAYSIDRWKNMSSNAATITLSSAGVQSTQTMAQYIGNVSALLGKTCTAAACWADGTVLVASGTITMSDKYKEFAASETVSGHRVMIVDNGNSKDVTVRVLGSADSPVAWVALYEGEYTAATLPPYIPKGYAAELAECRRYFVRDVAVCTMGTQYTSANGLVAIHIPRMRINPTITLKSASSQGWGTIELSKFSAGWSSASGSGYTMNYVYSGTADTRGNFIGVTFTLQYEASADL